MMTSGGANSGNTSRLACAAAQTPATSSKAARLTTTTRWRIDPSTMACSMSVVVHVAAELLGEQHLRLPRDNGFTGRDAGGEHTAIPLAAEHLHLAPLIFSRGGAHVNEGSPLVVQQRRRRHGHGIANSGVRNVQQGLDQQ